MARLEFASLLLVLLASLEAANCLQCHYCEYKKAGDEEFGTRFCEKPKGDVGKWPLTGCYTGGGFSSEKSVFGCGKVVATKGKQLHDNSSVSYGVWRECVGFPKSSTKVKEGCKEQPKSKWDEGTDQWSQYVSFHSRYYSLDTEVEACYCAEDECNAAHHDLVASSVGVLWLVAASAVAVAQNYLN